MTHAHSGDFGFFDPERTPTYTINAAPSGRGWLCRCVELGLEFVANEQREVFGAASHAIAAKLGCAPHRVLVSVTFG